VSGIFGGNRPVYLKPSGHRRRWSVPGWVWVLACGIALGVAAVLAWQQQGPKRLTRAESATFHERAERAQAGLGEANRALEEARRQLETARAEAAQSAAAAKAARTLAQSLKQDLALLGEALPADPRGGEIGVRVAQFQPEGSEVAWQVLLTRAPGAARELRGAVEITLYGKNAEGRPEMLRAEAVPVVFEGAYLKAQGRASIKPEFSARQAMVRVLEAGGSKVLGTRTFHIR